MDRREGVQVTKFETSFKKCSLDRFFHGANHSGSRPNFLDSKDEEFDIKYPHGL